MISISEHTLFEENLKNIVVVDLGACEGTFLKGCLNSFEVQKYIAVEANPGQYKVLLSLAMDNIHVIHAAVVANSNKGKAMTFYVDPESIFNSSLLWSNRNWVPHEVQTISLVDIIKRYSLQKIDILKMDVEGAEWEILDEFTPALFDMVDQITVEFHDFIKPEYRKKTKEIVRKLKGLGYRHVYKGIKYMHNSVYYDSLFYKSDKKQTFLEKAWEKINPVKYY